MRVRRPKTGSIAKITTSESRRSSDWKERDMSNRPARRDSTSTKCDLSAGELTSGDRESLCRAAWAAEPTRVNSSAREDLYSTVERILADRLAQVTARAERAEAQVERVREVIGCPHGRHGDRHYYALDGTCQRCDLPSWVEALIRAALAETADSEEER